LHGQLRRRAVKRLRALRRELHHQTTRVGGRLLPLPEHDDSVTVTDSAGTSASYHTNSDGDADVYLKAPESARGETVTAHAGSATCTGTL
jgi:hypothetical protein